MKRITLLAISASMLLATNGDNLTALGAKARAMGGVGIATFFGAENTLSNPALIGKSKGTEIDFGATLFMPDVKARGEKSSADTNVIPEISISQKINENWSFGIGMFGSAGMGVDYRGSSNPLLMQARTNLLLMKFAPAIAYSNDKLSIGFAPVLQYGSLDISYNNSGTQVGKGSSDDFGFGFETGATYDITNDFRVGLIYKSSIKMKYERTLSIASQPFVPPFSSAFADDLEQPAEYGIGTSYNYGNFNFSFDYKKVKWASAKGYKDFGWKDQDIYALGAKYEQAGTWYAIGYNYAKNPLTNYAGTTPKGAVLNLFNYLMFPATEETHYSVGAGTKITKNLSLGASLVYAPKKSITTNLSGMGIPSLKVDHSETSLTFSLKYNF